MATTSSVNSVSKSADHSVLDPEKETNLESNEKQGDLEEENQEDLEEENQVASPTDSDEEIEYPKSWKLGLITLALCLSVFCMALDNTIIATAIPKITDHFHALDDVGW
jgi:hypothetical protein